MKLFTNNAALAGLLLLSSAPIFAALAVEQSAAPQTLTPATTESKNTNTTNPQILSVETATEQLKAWDVALKYMDTSFSQTTTYDGVLISQSQGKLYYAKDQNFLRLDTLSPDELIQQTAVTDKKIIVMFDEKGSEITKLSWQEWQAGQPNKALFDFGNYTALLAQHNAKIFEVTPDYAVLELTPKKGNEYQLFLSLSRQDFFPQVITIVSDLMRTEAQLDKTLKNKKLSTQLFKGVIKK